MSVALNRERRRQRKRRDGEAGRDRVDSSSTETGVEKKRKHTFLIRTRCPPQGTVSLHATTGDVLGLYGSGGIGKKGMDERVVVAQSAQDAQDN
jgi:ABC-type sugar transport system ATPase subunit